MSVRRFSIDTNVLIYAADRAAGAKHDLAFELLVKAVTSDCVITLQALGEFYAAVTRKRMLPARTAMDQIENWMVLFPTCTADGEALRAALRFTTAGHCGFWDGMMLATAAQAGCRFLLSEDMHDGMTLGGVTVRNPFAGSALAADVEQMLGA